MKLLRSILVATDLTETSDEVLRAAAALAALTDAELHVLHAFDLELLPYTEKSAETVGFAERIRAAEQELDGQISRVVPPDVRVARRDVEIFVAHRAILERADAVAADLIVFGPHKRRPLGDAFLGSTADRVIRSADVPCLVVRGPLRLPLRQVMVPLDLSEPAIAALELALVWSDAFRPHGDDMDVGPRVTVLHVMPRMLAGGDFPFDHAMIGPGLHKAIEGAVARSGAGGNVEVVEEVSWGDTPSEEILQAAVRDDADLLVLATHGHGAVKRALIGSVAAAVARESTIPVLLVPPALWSAGGGDART